MTSVAPPLDAAEANALAEQFYAASTALDKFRLSFDPPLPLPQRKRLKDEADALESRAQYFTAEAIGATLASIQSDLARIDSTTNDAVQQLKHLEDVQKGIAIATSLLTLGTAIAAGNPATIIAAAQGLGELLA